MLDTTGGPSWTDGHLDAPIIVNGEKGEFYKQPAYYALAHFSKYIPRGSVRIDASVNILTTDVGAVAFLRPDGAITVVLHNK